MKAECVKVTRMEQLWVVGLRPGIPQLRPLASPHHSGMSPARLALTEQFEKAQMLLSKVKGLAKSPTARAECCRGQKLGFLPV